jgi:hypothetical protein
MACARRVMQSYDMLVRLLAQRIVCYPILHPLISRVRILLSFGGGAARVDVAPGMMAMIGETHL